MRREGRPIPGIEANWLAMPAGENPRNPGLAADVPLGKIQPIDAAGPFRMRKPPAAWQEKIVSLSARRGRRALLQAADDRGWVVRQGDLRWTPRTPLYVYLLEPIRKQTVMGVVNWENLAEIEESSRSLSWQETMNALTGMLAEDDVAEARSVEDRGRRLELLMTLAARYVAGTETFRRVPSETADAHFIVLVYRPKGLDDPDGILRPFALVARDRHGLLQPEELTEISQRVIEQDRAAHPDWFPLATVHHFPLDTP